MGALSVKRLELLQHFLLLGSTSALQTFVFIVLGFRT
jgi:hypothetical protein